jgi:hypothetical protein
MAKQKRKGAQENWLTQCLFVENCVITFLAGKVIEKWDLSDAVLEIAQLNC